jgi:2-polyprenyl-6-hydroxyphenyl methylase/3-demethylubiquinone-9 3-methyltransferase
MSFDSKGDTGARPLRFAFGRNWRRFVERELGEEDVAHARESFCALVGVRDLKGLSFLDVGCGSGLSSLVAHQLGAARLVSFDLDEDSVRCCRDLHERSGAPGTWQVRTGSILDSDLVSALGTFDMVYAWGVLHHTGRMWDAIDQACRLVAPGGRLVIAIYNHADAIGLYPDGRFGPSRLWVGLKRAYCRLPSPLQILIDWGALGLFVATSLVTLRSPRRRLREYRQQRGMSLRTDIRDWLGGYPYEYASVEEVFQYTADRGFALETLRMHGGLRCNEFVLRRPTH